jgi:hypothetical protein
LRKSGRPQADQLARSGAAVNFRIAREDLQHGEIDRLGRRAHLAPNRLSLERPDQGFDAGKIELAFAPVEEVERLEAMLLDPLDLVGPEFGERVARQR